MTKTTIRQDLDWADRMYKPSVLKPLERWLRHEDTDEELRETVTPFLEAACTRKGLNQNRTHKLHLYILLNHLPSLRTKRERSADELWKELSGLVLQLVDRHHDEQQERPYAEVDEADRTMLRDSDDPTADIVERLQSDSEPDEITEAQVLHVLEEFPKFLSEWKHSQEPIYQLLQAHPGKHRMLIVLQVLVGSPAFEEFTKEFAGQTLTIPSSNDYEEFSETREMFQLLASGKTQKEIATKLGISQEAVSQRFKNLKARRHDTWWKQNQSFLKALYAAFNLMVRAKARIRLHMGRNK